MAEPRLALLASPNGWYARDLGRAAAGICRLDTLRYAELKAGVGGQAPLAAGEKNLLDYRAVLARTMPPASLEQVVFRMDALLRLESAGVRVINRPKAIETAVDKYLALVRLEAAGLAVPATLVCQHYEQAMEAYHALGGDVVVKPLFGGEGRGLLRVTDEAMAHRTMRTLTQLQHVVYVQKFLPHDGCDVRLLVIGQRVLAVRRRNECDWRTNVAQGGRAEPMKLTPFWEALALRAAAAIGAELAGVDVLERPEGEPVVLEVNASPGWRAVSRTLQLDVADLIVRHALDARRD